MGLTSERAAYAVIAASIALAVLSRMTWVYVHSLSGVLSFISMGPFGVKAHDLHNVTQSDGDTVAIIAGVCAGIALISLAGPPIRRMCGAAIGVCAGIAATIALVNVADAVRGTVDYGNWEHAQAGNFTIAFPLVATVVVSAGIMALGALIAVAQDQSPIANELTEDGALQW